MGEIKGGEKMKEDNKIANAFYDEDYDTLSIIFGKQIRTQKQAEKEYELWHNAKIKRNNIIKEAKE